MHVQMHDFTLTTNGYRVQVICDNFTFNCDKINNWIAQNTMGSHADRTHLMIQGTDIMTRSAEDTHVTLSNTVITKTSTEKLL